MTPAGARSIEWDARRLTWAAADQHHPLDDADAYARANLAGLVGVKVAQGGSATFCGAAMVKAAEARGLVVVGYEYGDVHPDAFLKLFPPRPGRIPCLHFEGVGVTVEAAEDWVRVVRDAYGRPPWFHCGINWIQAGSPGGTVVEACPWWGPRYGNSLRPLRGVGAPVAWQYSEGIGGPTGAQLEHPGVRGRCCMSALLVDVAELQAMAGLEERA